MYEADSIYMDGNEICKRERNGMQGDRDEKSIQSEKNAPAIATPPIAPHTPPTDLLSAPLVLPPPLAELSVLELALAAVVVEGSSVLVRLFGIELAGKSTASVVVCFSIFPLPTLIHNP